MVVMSLLLLLLVVLLLLTGRHETTLQVGACRRVVDEHKGPIRPRCQAEQLLLQALADACTGAPQDSRGAITNSMTIRGVTAIGGCRDLSEG
jgi:hypothetical protein